MRGYDLSYSHRWPEGACHIRPSLRSPVQHAPSRSVPIHISRSQGSRIGAVTRADQVFDLSLGREMPSCALLRLRAEPGAPVTGVAFWVPWPPLAVPLFIMSETGPFNLSQCLL